jgi:hypothetical protein
LSSNTISFHEPRNRVFGTRQSQFLELLMHPRAAIIGQLWKAMNPFDFVDDDLLFL